MTEVWSYGGGMQTAAIAVLIAQGKLPLPDMVVMADTGREAETTWRYLDDVMRPFLNQLNLSVGVAPHRLATVDLYGKNGDLLIPAFTRTGKLPTFCSNEWKRRVVARYLRAVGVRRCRLWLGISADELERAKIGQPPAWIVSWYPLLTGVYPAVDRTACAELVRKAGLPTPPRSACWMCPLRSNYDWRAVRQDPDDWKRAVELDATIRERDPNVFLHRSGVPLAEADLEATRTDQQDLLCETGHCWV